MCGDFRRNFEEIPTLPEQTTVKTEGFGSSSEGKTPQIGAGHFVDEGYSALVSLMTVFFPSRISRSVMSFSYTAVTLWVSVSLSFVTPVSME